MLEEDKAVAKHGNVSITNSHIIKIISTNYNDTREFCSCGNGVDYILQIGPQKIKACTRCVKSLIHCTIEAL